MEVDGLGVEVDGEVEVVVDERLLRPLLQIRLRRHEFRSQSSPEKDDGDGEESEKEKTIGR